MISRVCVVAESLSDLLSASSAYLKQGKAHLRMSMSGSMSRAMPSRTMMLVRRVANSPSSFMRLRRMVAIMLWNSVMPCSSEQARPFSIPNTSCSSRRYLSQAVAWPVSLCPSQLERLQIIWAQSSPRFSMTARMKRTKVCLSRSLSWMTMPASIRLMKIFSFSFRISLRTSISSRTYYRYSCFSDSESTVSAFRRYDSTYARSRTKSRTSVKKLQGCGLTSMKMLPPWQSAWMKLFFISISKKASEPSRAITLFSGCLLSSKQVTGCPSTKDSTSTISFVFSSIGEGKLTSLRFLNISMKMLRFFISKVKSICSIRVFFSEEQLTGIQQAGEMKEARWLRKNRMSMSRSMCLSTPGCRTFTATFFPLYTALQTWLTDPEAIGSGSNSSKISSTFLPQDSRKYFLVVSREWVGAFSRRYSNLEASSGPMMSLRWLRYWKALMKTTPERSMAFTNRSIQQPYVRLKNSSGDSSSGGAKISSSWQKRTRCTSTLHTRPSSDGARTPIPFTYTSALLLASSALVLSYWRCREAGMQTQQAARSGIRMFLRRAVRLAVKLVLRWCDCRRRKERNSEQNRENMAIGSQSTLNQLLFQNLTNCPLNNNASHAHRTPKTANAHFAFFLRNWLFDQQLTQYQYYQFSRQSNRILFEQNRQAAYFRLNPQILIRRYRLRLLTNQYLEFRK